MSDDKWDDVIQKTNEQVRAANLRAMNSTGVSRKIHLMFSSFFSFLSDESRIGKDEGENNDQ